MNYTEALNKIDSLLVFGSQPGLDRIKMLLSLMGDPQDNVHFIHVAGTNGKGSVCNMLSSVLTKAGYKTGLFTSPHITGFGERMQINGNEISEEDTIALVEKLFPLVEELRAKDIIITEFEFVAAMAFQWFYDKGCDTVVLETGLGGRFDATNVIKTPLCSVITSISFDHTAILGDTLGKIAFEKCGIIKENGHTVFGLQQDEVNECVRNAANERSNKLHISKPLSAVSTDLFKTVVDSGDMTINMPLLGEHQLKNLSLVLSAVEALREQGYSITNEQIKLGVESVKLPARFEKLSAEPLIIADGAHNPDGMKALSMAVDRYLADKTVICVLGMLRDKDCLHAVANMQGKVKKLFATTVPDNPRRQTAEELKETISPLGFDTESCEDPHTAVDKALEEVKKYPDGMLLICGSLYLVSELRGYVGAHFVR